MFALFIKISQISEDMNLVGAQRILNGRETKNVTSDSQEQGQWPVLMEGQQL